MGRGGKGGGEGGTEGRGWVSGGGRVKLYVTLQKGVGRRSYLTRGLQVRVWCSCSGKRGNQSYYRVQRHQ